MIGQITQGHARVEITQAGPFPGGQVLVEDAEQRLLAALGQDALLLEGHLDERVLPDRGPARRPPQDETKRQRGKVATDHGGGPGSTTEAP